MSLVSSHYVHLLALRKTAAGVGWYAPYELKDDSFSNCCLAIPLPGGEPESSYWMEVVYRGDGVRQADMHSLVRESAKTFILEHNVVALRFRLVTHNDKPATFRYAGGLLHDDFAFRLAAIEPERDEAFDIVLEQMGAALVGCDPFKHYRKSDGSSL